LKWGLPLVLGGALGNLSDRITRGEVIDFIDYRGDWVRSMNTYIQQYWTGWTVTDHWPTFNVADVAICAGVALMAIDMFTSKRGHAPPPEQPSKPPEPAAEAPPESREVDPNAAALLATPPPGQRGSADPADVSLAGSSQPPAADAPNGK
jgi:signal peptidase II